MRLWIYTLFYIFFGLRITYSSTFNEQLLNYYDRKIFPSTHLIGKAITYRYVFVGGFLNEGIPGYFTDNRAALRDLAIPLSHIHMIYPSSKNSVEENMGVLATEINRIADDRPEKVIIIAHSKGAVETLAAFLDNFETLNRKIEHIVLIQGAFYGSQVAAAIKGEGRRVQVDYLNWTLSDWGYYTSFFSTLSAGMLLDTKINPSFESMVPATSTELLQNLLRANKQYQQLAANKISFITSSKRISRMSEILDCTGWYLTQVEGPNDGLVATREQQVEGLGNILGHLEADHAELVVSKFNNQNRRYRKAFTWAVLSKLFEK